MDGKRRLIDKDALLRDLQSSRETVEIIDRNLNPGEEDKMGRRYCEYLCRIISMAEQIVEKQEEVTEP